MAYSKQDVASLEQPVRTGGKLITKTLDGTTTSQVLELGDVFSKVSFQASGDLAGNVTFSLDGVQWQNSTPLGSSGAIVTFSTHNVSAVKVTRTGGSGKVAFGCK